MIVNMQLARDRKISPEGETTDPFETAQEKLFPA
jgi:hypothetical protein